MSQAGLKFGVLALFAVLGGAPAHATENITNNYYGDSTNQHAADVLQDQDQDQDDAQDASDNSSDLGSSYDDGGFGGDSSDA